MAIEKELREGITLITQGTGEGGNILSCHTHNYVYGRAKATSEIVMNMVNELPELQRATVLAFYYDDMKIDDIARVFECSANTIKSRLNYAGKLLKEKVTEHEKQNHYKLCSLSPAILLLAFQSLFATDGYTLSKATAQAVYNTTCGVVGLVPSAITVGGTVVGESDTWGTPYS